MSQKKRSNVITWILVLAVVGLIGVNVAYVLTRDGNGIASEDAKAPNFTLPVVNPTEDMGDEFELADAKGKVAVLEFWSTTCGICVKTFPNIDHFHRIADSDELVVLTINSDRGSSDYARKAIGEFLSKNDYEVPVLLDNGSVSNAYGITAVPTTVVIDRDGTVRKIHQGAMSPSQLKHEVDELM